MCLRRGSTSIPWCYCRRRGLNIKTRPSNKSLWALIRPSRVNLSHFSINRLTSYKKSQIVRVRSLSQFLFWTKMRLLPKMNAETKNKTIPLKRYVICLAKTLRPALRAPSMYFIPMAVLTISSRTNHLSTLSFPSSPSQNKVQLILLNNSLRDLSLIVHPPVNILQRKCQQRLRCRGGTMVPSRQTHKYMQMKTMRV